MPPSAGNSTIWSRRDFLRLAASTPVGVLAAPGVAVADPLSANIFVQADQVYRQIPPELFGTTVEWNNNAGGLWRPDLDDFDPAIVDLCQQMAPAVVRFPGGFLTDFYHWQSGIGPRNERFPVSAWPGSKNELNLFGTDEALDFASKIGANLFISVNVGTGTAEEAAGWVEYVNGKSPGRVKYWERNDPRRLEPGCALPPLRKEGGRGVGARRRGREPMGCPLGLCPSRGGGEASPCRGARRIGAQPARPNRCLYPVGEHRRPLHGH